MNQKPEGRGYGLRAKTVGLVKLAESLASDFEYPIEFTTNIGEEEIIASYDPTNPERLSPRQIFHLVRDYHSKGKLTDHRMVTSTYILEQQGLRLDEEEKAELKKIGYAK